MEKSAGKENCENYYPFGLTYNNYSRENSLANQYKFQGQEHQDELDLGWNHMSEIGRFFNVDPLAEKYSYSSPYAFSENQVTSHRELEGLEKYDIKMDVIPYQTKTINLETTALITSISDMMHSLSLSGSSLIASSIQYPMQNTQPPIPMTNDHWVVTRLMSELAAIGYWILGTGYWMFILLIGY